jgi:hypothetical protein
MLFTTTPDSVECSSGCLVRIEALQDDLAVETHALREKLLELAKKIQEIIVIELIKLKLRFQLFFNFCKTIVRF